MSTTCGCSRPTRDGYTLCNTCKHELEQHLAEAKWLDEELDVTLTRVKGVDYNRTARRGADTPLPWNDRASRARAEVKTVLVGWFRLMWTKGEPIPADNLPAIAAWLLVRMDRIAKREDGWVIYDEIVVASIAARAVVFAKPDAREYIGPCEGVITDDGEEITETECFGEIFVREGMLDAACDECGRAYDANQARRVVQGKIEDRLLTSTEIAHLAHRTFGQPVDKVQRLVANWANPKRRRLVAHATNAQGVALYRYGDATALLADTYGERGA